MLTKILGIIWVVLGMWWLLKPEALKRRLKRKMNRRIKWTIYGSILIFAFLLIGSVMRTPGIIPKIIILIGVILAIRVITLFATKTADKVLDLWANRPLKFFRIWALVVLASGIMLIYL